MLKKTHLVLIIGLLLLLMLQFLEITNIKNIDDNVSAQKGVILTLNCIAIGLLSILLLLKTHELIPFWKSKTVALNTGNNAEDHDIRRSESIDSDFVTDNRHKALENTLVHVLARCNSLEDVCSKFLSATCNEFKLAQGILFVRKKNTDEFYIKGTFAYYNENTGYSFRLGEGICGQVAKNQKAIILTNIPDNYVNVVSGLGLGSPNYLQVIPIVFSGEVIGVLELASFTSELLQTNDLETGVLKQLSNSLKGFL